MKKFYLLLMVCLCLSGCSNWKNKVQVSDLKYEDNYIVGKIKNMTDNAYNATISLKLKSGSLEDETVCYETIKPNDTINLKCLIYDIDDTYLIEIDDIELEKFEIPLLKEGIIDVDTLEYHFQEIYDIHTLNFMTFSDDFTNNKYPYVDEASYEDNGIIITTQFEEYLSSFYSKYNTETNELEVIYGSIAYGDDEDLLNKVITKVSLMSSLNSSSLKIGRALLDTNIEDDLCWIVDEWCIVPQKDEGVYSFYIALNE